MGAPLAAAEVNELLEVLSAGRGRRVLCEFEYQIEDVSDVLGEIGNVGVKAAIVDGKETNLVVLERHELREVRCANGIQILSRSRPLSRAGAVVSR